MTLLSLILAGISLSGEEIFLQDSAPSATRAFWTWNGTSLPQKNRNLSGKTIKIGTTEFPHGICGHTPFSNTYILNGLADSFSAEIGAEATDHPKDPILPNAPPPRILFQFFADFKEIANREFTLGDAPHPIRLNLHGVHHFEIRALASGGRTSHRCRPALGNPVFHTENPEALLQNLWKNSAQPFSTPQYPEPPSLNGFNIQKTKWNNLVAYLIHTKNYELIITPECGGRAVSFARPGGPNILAPLQPFPRMEMLLTGGYPDITTGHFQRLNLCRPLLPDDATLETAPHTIEFSNNGEIITRSRKSILHGITQEFRYKLLPDSVIVTSRIQNNSPFARELEIWYLTRVDSSQLLSVKAGKRAIHSFNLNPEMEIPGEGEICAEFKDGTLFRLQPQNSVEKIKLFRSMRFTELEFLGITKKISPNEWLNFSERWSISKK